ncbi:SusC/RagA family TonB-linked outer membrane protein [Algibacter lectus]|uniref:TonB family protein n=1 Tax=Algibacter lectus TaxID=221126 RepID=A0A090W522_9FLAO|nr:TonB-dependent receptor [Algibacter lectus]MWW25212.1 SusC/RagA family TonB-linked outer membrane protein [Algibacter lectus]TDY64373.1 TonB-linked SusC/RagA family outer membrane protein [Algibacter lectus]GAL62632.1 TonB family protein [Algibacter lectus]
MMKFKLLGMLLAMFCMQNAFSQAKTISGTVSDTGGMPLPGVSVIVLGTTNGASTDFDGNFSLKNVNIGDQITVSYVGMATKTLTVGNQNTLKITLEESLEALEAIVVVGYGKQSRATVTGAVSTVDAEEMSALPVTNAESALQGRAPGITVVNGGVPGSSPVVLIRGLGTFGNNSPLYVIDGVIVGNLSGISPNDIENVSILKDASTTAIYGARGSNGVVLVTTKKGKSGKSQLSFNTYTGFQQNTKRYNTMNTIEYLQHAGNLGVFPNRPLSTYKINTNYQDEIFRTGMMQNHSLNYSAGTDKSSQYFSAEYLKQEGIIVNTGFERYSFRANSSVNIGKLKVGESMALSFGKQNPELSGGGRSLITHAIKAAPYLPVYNSNNDGGFQGPSSSADGQDAENPVRIQTHPTSINKTLSVIGNLYADLEIIEGLNYKTQVGLDYFTFDGNTFTPSFSDDSVDGSSTHAQNYAEYGRSHTQGQTLIFTNSLSYSTTIAEKHNLELLALAEKTENKSTNFGGSARNLITNELVQFGATTPSIGSGSSETNRLGYLGRVNYNFEDKYILSASIRRDASSRFGANNRWGTFPSASLGWNIAKENFLDDSNVSNLKLRASYGVVGNDNIGDYLYSATLTGNFEYPLGDGNGAGVTANGGANPDLKWEETTMFNVGLDFGLNNGQFTASLEYYRNQSDDLLLSLPAPLSNGINAGNITANVGSVETSGVELALGFNDYEGDFTWSANLNLGTSGNEVLSLGSLDAFEGAAMKDGKGNISRTTVGESLFHFYGLVSDGIYQTPEEVAAVFTSNPGQTTVQPGDVRYKDLNGDGDITSEDRDILANPYPDFTYGLNLSANYKNFDLNLYITGIEGVDIYNTNKYDLEAGANRLFNGSKVLLDSWTPTNPSTTQPRVPGAPQNHSVSDRYIEDGSFTRLKNISLGYTFTDGVFENYFSKLRLYVSAQNLITLTDYSGLDPEIGQGNQEFGIDRGLYPQPKSVILGLQVSF